MHLLTHAILSCIPKLYICPSFNQSQVSLFYFILLLFLDNTIHLLIKIVHLYTHTGYILTDSVHILANTVYILTHIWSILIHSENLLNKIKSLSNFLPISSTTSTQTTTRMRLALIPVNPSNPPTQQNLDQQVKRLIKLKSVDLKMIKYLINR